MFFLTAQERKVLLLIGAVILFGALLRFFHVSFEIPTSHETQASISLINLNAATQKDLESLPGIGPTIATRMLEYRKVHGQFRTLEDVKRVKGIGEKKASQLKSHVSF
jgi:competence protein ComEA